MYPDPGPQRSDDLRRFRQMNEQGRRGGAGSGLGGLLKLALLVGVVVLLVQNPELRTEAWTFVQNLWTDVQNG